jgi:hypothetical protein
LKLPDLLVVEKLEISDGARGSCLNEGLSTKLDQHDP